MKSQEAKKEGDTAERVPDVSVDYTIEEGSGRGSAAKK